eukprot:scaffold66896_cov14-Tisochrysis_lutea.AAC.1
MPVFIRLNGTGSVIVTCEGAIPINASFRRHCVKTRNVKQSVGRKPYQPGHRAVGLLQFLAVPRRLAGRYHDITLPFTLPCQQEASA